MIKKKRSNEKKVNNEIMKCTRINVKQFSLIRKSYLCRRGKRNVPICQT